MTFAWITTVSLRGVVSTGACPIFESPVGGRASDFSAGAVASSFTASRILRVRSDEALGSVLAEAASRTIAMNMMPPPQPDAAGQLLAMRDVDGPRYGWTLQG